MCSFGGGEADHCKEVGVSNGEEKRRVAGCKIEHKVDNKAHQRYEDLLMAMGNDSDPM